MKYSIGAATSKSVPSYLSSVADERHALEAAGPVLPDHQHRLVRLEAVQLRGDRLVGAARNRRVARRHLDAVGRRGFDAARDHQQRRERVAHVGGAEQEDRHGDREHAAERAGIAADGIALDATAVFERAHLLDGVLHQLPHERRRRGRLPGPLGFHGADDRRLERRFVLLEIQGDLLVGHAAQQRPDDAQVGHDRDHHRQEDPEQQDGVRREPHPLQRHRGADERHRDAARGNRRAAQRQLHAPALAHVVDDC